MSHRPTSAKKIRRLRKALRRSLPAHIDLIDWLKTRGYAQTTGEARKIILDRHVRSESHVLGIKKIPTLVGDKVEDVDIVVPYVPAELRSTLRVAS